MYGFCLDVEMLKNKDVMDIGARKRRNIKEVGGTLIMVIKKGGFTSVAKKFNIQNQNST